MAGQDRAIHANQKRLKELYYVSGSYVSEDRSMMPTRLAYLAHDDGWHCKLYCKETDGFMDVLCGKIKSYVKVQVSDVPIDAEVIGICIVIISPK